MIKLVAAYLTDKIREQSLGVNSDARDKLDISLLRARLFAMRDKQLGTSLATDKQAVVPIATARRNATRTADVEVCDLPRLEEISEDLVVDTRVQATTPALGGQADWAGLSIGLEKLG